MTRKPDRILVAAGRRLAAVALAVCASLAPGTALAQDVPLPAPPVTAAPSSREVVISWPEAGQTEGRIVSNVNRSTLGDSASTVTIVGSYALDCDYRLRITKLPKDPGLNRHVQLVYEITDNISGVGLALRSDTLDVYVPNQDYSFDPDIAGDLGIRFGPNVNQPTSPLGTVLVTTGGLNTSSSASQYYFATALNSVNSLSDTLRVKVAGPVVQPVPSPLPAGTVVTTLLVTTPGQAFSIQDGQTISFSDGHAAPGDTTGWTARYLFAPSGIIRADLQAFEGYHLWRSDLPDVDDFTLLGEIQQCASKHDFVLVSHDELLSTHLTLDYDSVARVFTVTDHDIHDDFPYRYAVSTFDRGFLGNPQDLTYEGERVTTEKLYPAARQRIASQKAYVVPNPYIKRSAFQEGGPRVVFANLPTTCTIRIFTVSADYVTTLRHGPGEPGSTSPTSREWDLRSEAGKEVAPGIYLYYIDGTNRVETPLAGGGTNVVTQPFQQVGKLMIAR
jgi:hypothetical protein